MIAVFEVLFLVFAIIFIFYYLINIGICMYLIRIQFSYNLKHIPLINIIRTMTHKVFVYGTLKRTEPNHNWITDDLKGYSKFICEGVTKEKYPLIIATKYNIPFLLQKPGVGYNVHGEVYEVDDSMLAHLDILEDHPNYYVREIDDILLKNGGAEENIVQCWTYFLKNFKSNLLNSPYLENYSSRGCHGRPYLERSKRDPLQKYNPRDEVLDK